MNSRKDLAGALAALEEHSTNSPVKHFWRSLEEAADSEAFAELMRQEFPEQADVWPDALDRRRFLNLMGASLTLGGLGGCSVKPAPVSELAPYVRSPEQIIPGRPLFFATTMAMAGNAVGLLVESHLGRPTKVEGNPDHPASRGATDIYHQASILTLYDPDRSQSVTHLGQPATWDEAARALRAEMAAQRDGLGAGMRILTETIVSPTLAAQLEHLLGELPRARWYAYEPIHNDAARAASRMAFGRYVDAVYDFTKADIVVSLDADFLSPPGNLQYAADFMSRRRVRTSADDAPSAQMNRLYVVEGAVTCAGAKADHRLAMKPSQIESFARDLTAALGIGKRGESASTHPWVEAIADDLSNHRGRSLVVAGASQSAAVHLLAQALNEQLGNVGQTVKYIEPIEARGGPRTESLAELARDMELGAVEFLVILGGNPVYTAPADLNFAKALEKVPLRVHLSLYEDETSRRCHWHLPETHYLEAWGDARAFNGTASLAQPLIEPLYAGRSAIEVAALLAEAPERSGKQIVRAYWRNRREAAGHRDDFEQFWQTALHDGVIANSAHEPLALEMQDGWKTHLEEQATSAGATGSASALSGGTGFPGVERVADATGRSTGRASGTRAESQLEIIFQADPTIFDGRFANNGWLQELPKPITKLTWDNAAIVSPDTAARLCLARGDYAHGGEHGGFYMPVVELQLQGCSVRAPVWIMPGHVDDSVTVHLGYGRAYAGRVGGTPKNRVGFDAYTLRTSERPWFAGGLQLKPTGKQFLVACTQAHNSMENRDLVRAATLSEYRADPEFASRIDAKHLQTEQKKLPQGLTLYEPFDYSTPKNKWGMSIDLTTCIGCNACIVACQAENNIPLVGKDQVSRGREMHWLRVDRYVGGSAREPDAFHFQPVPCMHCENAPCEYVCPVAATVHSSEGLNDMVYNRCVGTRFCSNNCPYKVRRFNFLHYSDWETPTRRLQYNPDVTVRSRGVMEKCTYCVQRIRQAEIASQVEGRPIVDGEVLTACQAACPTQAIVFGDMNDRDGAVAASKGSPLNYGLLAELNTAPRTTYLAALRNPNPRLERLST